MIDKSVANYLDDVACFFFRDSLEKLVCVLQSKFIRKALKNREAGEIYTFNNKMDQ